LNQLFYGFNELATAEEKAAAAQELFGKAGRELIPELNKGADAFETAKRKALDYGVTVNEVASSNAQKTVENIGMIKNAFSGLVNQFASSNILTDIFGTIKTYAFEIVENIRKWGPTAEDALTRMLPVIDSIELSSRRMIDGIKLSYAGLLYFIAQSNLDLNPLLTKESKAKYEMVAQRTQAYIENYDGGEYEPFSERYKRVSSEYDNSRKAQRSPQTDRIYDTSEYTNPANRKYLEEQNQLLRDIRDKVGGYK